MLKEYTVTMKVEVPIEVTVQALDEDNAIDVAWDDIKEPYGLMDVLDDVPRSKFDVTVEDVQGGDYEI